jgi:hypothetical protein
MRLNSIWLSCVVCDPVKSGLYKGHLNGVFSIGYAYNGHIWALTIFYGKSGSFSPHSGAAATS